MTSGGLRKRRVDAGGVGIHVAERGSGAAVLLLQGLGYSGDVWGPLPDRLAERRRAIAVDNRGSGRSAHPPGPYSIAAMAADAAAVLRALGAAPAHVLGLSMGGYIALTLALEHPALVRSLILAGTSAGGPGHVPVPAATLRAWEEHAGLAPAAFARATAPRAFAPGWPEAHAAAYERYLTTRLAHPTPAASWRAQYEAAEAFLRDGAPVERIDVPALVVHGDEDHVVPFANGEALAARLPRGRLVPMPARGHLAYLEDPDAFAGAVTGFLEEVERRGQ